ncbi:MAG: AAA family ATPase [Candidatus Schekmanbacteria bacterium]|nr:AAA family ATPase [Candidatus Schekmanbacteria bacterium]
MGLQTVTFVSKMVGRERESELILSEYETVAAGEFRSLFISGLSGIGKTRLIQELHRPIVSHRGYFASGKFDVYQRNIPYSSLIQALRGLVRTLLTESDEQVALWKSRILAAIGKHGKVLTDVISELAVLIGPQPSVKALPPVESLNRFRDTFDRFVACLASAENPLTLFIDDLQWCDAASFDFLTNILANHESHPHLFLLGAYRHNEVDSSHPLRKLVRNAEGKGWPRAQIRLAPLAPQHCHDMVAYILDSPRSQTRALAGFVAELSEGNPLYVSECLSYLHNEGLLYRDDDGQWRWDLAKIRRSDMPRTVVALFGAKIRKLPAELVSLLEYCACMGNTFSPSELATLGGMTLAAVFTWLKPALAKGLLVEARGQLQFIHDRVQEAVLGSIAPVERRRIHRQVGEHLLSAIPLGRDLEQVDNLFTIVSHLNLGRSEELTPEEARFLSALNYHAGNKALGSLAVAAANDYFGLARELLVEDCWQDPHYERTFRIFIQAIETANRGLAYFGKAIPASPAEANERRALLMEQIAAQDLDVREAILGMPFTTDRRSRIELAFYSELIPDLYMSGLVPQLYLSAAQSTAHCLAGGMDESVIYSFSIMGLQLGERDEFAQAFLYEDLARDLSARHPNTFGATRGMNGIVWCNAHSRSHPREIVDYCLKSIQCGKNCGDLYNAGLSYGPLMWNLQVQGADLEVIEDCARECLQFSAKYDLSFSVGLAEAMQAGWVGPMKGSPPQLPMEDRLRDWERNNHVASAGSYFVHRALAHYYLGEHEAAERHLEEVRRYLTGLTDNVLKRQWHVFLVLNELELHDRRGGEQGELMATIRPLLERIETWAELGPLLRPYLAFVHAEIERVTGNAREATARFLDAIHTAHEQGYTLLEGHLNECLGRHLERAGRSSPWVYFREAARLYRKCRADRKEVRLVEEYPEHFEAEAPRRPRSDAETTAAAAAGTTAARPDLDLSYFERMRAAVTSDEPPQVRLEQVMSAVIAGSGAERGHLFLDEPGGSTRPWDDGPEACRAIVRYVQRTGERIILSDASREGPFRDNPEVQFRRARSVLCLPLCERGRARGVLYLENRLAAGVFTPERTRTAELLASWATLAMENARLADRLTMVDDRTGRPADIQAYGTTGSEWAGR